MNIKKNKILLLNYNIIYKNLEYNIIINININELFKNKLIKIK
jgi:hypothetical protein